MGEKGLRYLPFIISLFFFILFANLLGLIPGTYTATSHIMVTASLAVVVFILSLVIGFMLHGVHFFSNFLPAGTPWWLAPFMVFIEIFSKFVRPFTLSVRLFLNMTAGHTVIAVVFGLVVAGGLMLGWIPLGFTVAIYLLELLVAFIQAFVFTVLSTVYFGESIKLH
jgi:F-type H+-transporting ATPase subunit a